jgi:hypothetical protein
MKTEGFLERLLKKLHLLREFHTQDEVFDDAIFLECDHTNFQKIIKSDTELRRAILAVFGLGIDEVIADGKSIIFNMKRARLNPFEQEYFSDNTEKYTPSLLRVHSLLQNHEIDLSKGFDPFLIPATVLGTFGAVVAAGTAWGRQRVLISRVTDDFFSDPWLWGSTLTASFIAVLSAYYLRKSSRFSLIKLLVFVIPLCTPFAIMGLRAKIAQGEEIVSGFKSVVTGFKKAEELLQKQDPH